MAQQVNHTQLKKVQVGAKEASMKYIKISIVILLVSFISIFAYKLTTNNSNNKISLTKEQIKEMLSYTID